MGIMVETVVSTLKRDSRYKDRLEHIEIIPPKGPIYGELKKELPHSIKNYLCLLYTSPSPRDQRGSRMPSSA